jgi:hypothetical protein
MVRRAGIAHRPSLAVSFYQWSSQRYGVLRLRRIDDIDSSTPEWCANV